MKRMGVGLVLFALLVGGFLFLGRRPPSGSLLPLPRLGQVTDFALTNQLGQAFGLADLRGQVWIADIIFTRCAGPCPIMTRHMAELQKALAGRAGVRLVTLTTDPDFDRPEVLQRYGERFGADPARWTFLTGSKSEIARLAIQGLRLTSLEKAEAERASPEDLFIHSTTFVLVDRHAALRGVFESTGEDIDFDTIRTSILKAVRALMREG